ncbi:MAG: hemin uptake protein HemP [Rhodanobacter sp.]
MSTPVLSPNHSPQWVLRSLRRAPTTLIPIATPRHITSQTLLDGARELVIQHQGGEYRLRLTRNDKLILTK